jgi:hypothetical protein
VAKTQSARIWELRASTDLARLLDQKGKRADARAMLAKIYACFTEGFNIPDLKDARVVMRNFRQPYRASLARKPGV